MLTTLDPPAPYSSTPARQLTNQEYNNIIMLAIETFGSDNQIQMLFEEMAELQNAICKYARSRDSTKHICEEIADVMIMCRQMALIFGDERVKQYTNHKLLRLADRLANLTQNNIDSILNPQNRKDSL